MCCRLWGSNATPIRFDRRQRIRVEELAGATGLEPAASAVTGTRSNQLNYAPALPHDFPAVPSDGLEFPFVPFCRAVLRFGLLPLRQTNQRYVIGSLRLALRL